MESQLAFLDYVKAFDKVKRDKLFEILHCTNIPSLLLNIIEIYSRKKQVQSMTVLLKM